MKKDCVNCGARGQEAAICFVCGCQVQRESQFEFARAWKDSNWRQNAIYGVAREVSKTGEFSGDFDFVDELRGLGESEIVEFYKAVRDVSRRFEGEWRLQFLGVYPSVADLLPAQLEEQPGER